MATNIVRFHLLLMFPNSLKHYSKIQLQWQCNTTANTTNCFLKANPVIVGTCMYNLANITLHDVDGFKSYRDTLAAFLYVQKAFKCFHNLISFIRLLTYETVISTNVTSNKTSLVFKGVSQKGVLTHIYTLCYFKLLILLQESFLRYQALRINLRHQLYL